MVMVAASMLFMSVAFVGFFNAPTAHGAPSRVALAGDTPLLQGTVSIFSTTTQTNTRFTLTNTSGNVIKGLTLYEFYTRPTGYMPNTKSPACSTPVLSYTPSISVKDPTMSCPWFTCNYLSWTQQGAGECNSVGINQDQLNLLANATTAQDKAKILQGKTSVVFRSLQPAIPQADTFMALPLNQASLAPGVSLKLDSCIYYDNWPHTDSKQHNTLVVYSGNTLIWGTPPSGVNMQSVLKANAGAAPPVVTGNWLAGARH